MNVIVDSGQVSLYVPAKLSLFCFLQALKLFDEIELEFSGYPGCKLKGDIFMGISSTITTGLGNYTNGIGAGYPVFTGEDKTV